MTIVDIFFHTITNYFGIFFEHGGIGFTQFSCHFVSDMN